LQDFDLTDAVLSLDVILEIALSTRLALWARREIGLLGFVLVPMPARYVRLLAISAAISFVCFVLGPTRSPVWLALSDAFGLRFALWVGPICLASVLALLGMRRRIGSFS
jgi:hypothetical protein